MNRDGMVVVMMGGSLLRDGDGCVGKGWHDRVVCLRHEHVPPRDIVILFGGDDSGK